MCKCKCTVQIKNFILKYLLPFKIVMNITIKLCVNYETSLCLHSNNKLFKIQCMVYNCEICDESLMSVLLNIFQTAYNYKL